MRSGEAQLLGYLTERICLANRRKWAGLRDPARFDSRRRGRNAGVAAVAEGAGGNISKLHCFAAQTVAEAETRPRRITCIFWTIFTKSEYPVKATPLQFTCAEY